MKDEFEEKLNEISKQIKNGIKPQPITARTFINWFGAQRRTLWNVRIVTTSDLSLQFRQLGEPFLLLGEIENYIRKMILDKFKNAELKAACDSTDSERKIESISDLTLGEYVRLIENPDNWDKLSISVDREIFIKKLDEIRRIRNDVMHFDPDGITEEDINKLREFVRLLQNLARVGVI